MKTLLKLLAYFLIGNVLNKTVPFVGNPIAENCVACQFIWENIEEALATGENFLDEGKRNPILAAQAFQYFCKNSADIFFEPCNYMFEKLYFMTQDFCAKKKIVQICIDNEFCNK
jgi:hypothetical protein